MLRKTDRDIYKLRKMKTASKGQLDILAFKEKMAFFTTIKNEVPAVITTSEIDSDTEQIDDEDTPSESGSTLKHALTSRLDQLSLEEGVVDNCEQDPPRSRSVDNVQERFTYEIDPDIGVIV